jgi:Domain of unknown function (DUF4314)
MTLTPGTRVEVTGRMDDPNPLEIGEQGNVVSHRNVGSQFEQINVKWDSGRSLMLLPHDPFRVVS